MLKNKKFKLTDESITMSDGSKVFRIEALSNFHDVAAGDLGGFVEKEGNLSFAKKDDSWIYDDAIVCGSSEVKNNSFIYNDAVIINSIIDASTIRFSSRVQNSTYENTQA